MLAIVAGILVARHLKTTDDLFDSRSSPRAESLVAAAVQWAERIMRKIDGVFPRSALPETAYTDTCGDGILLRQVNRTEPKLTRPRVGKS